MHNLQTMIETPVKFPKDRPDTVGGVALTRYLLQICDNAPRITHYAPGKAKYDVPFLFFEKAGNNKGIAFDANTLSQLLFQICIRFDSSLFTNKVGITRPDQLRSCVTYIFGGFFFSF